MEEKKDNGEEGFECKPQSQKDHRWSCRIACTGCLFTNSCRNATWGYLKSEKSYDNDADVEQDERERDIQDAQKEIQEATQLAAIPASNTEKEPAEKCQ